MRSTRATAAIARLNERSAGEHYMMVITGDGLFKLYQRVAGSDEVRSEALALDDFVQRVNATGPQKVLRVTKNDAAFAKQLVKKPKL